MTSTTLSFIFIPSLCSLLLMINAILSPRNPYTEKNNPFECGFLSFIWQNRVQFSISFFLFALLFLLFDLEVLLVYPYFVSTYTNDIYGLITMVIFLILLVIGFGFELGKKALVINSKQLELIFIDFEKANENSLVNSLNSTWYVNIYRIILFLVNSISYKTVNIFTLLCNILYRYKFVNTNLKPMDHDPDYDPHGVLPWDILRPNVPSIDLPRENFTDKKYTLQDVAYQPTFIEATEAYKENSRTMARCEELIEKVNKDLAEYKKEADQSPEGYNAAWSGTWEGDEPVTIGEMAEEALAEREESLRVKSFTIQFNEEGKRVWGDSVETYDDPINYTEDRQNNLNTQNNANPQNNVNPQDNVNTHSDDTDMNQLLPTDRTNWLDALLEGTLFDPIGSHDILSFFIVMMHFIIKIYNLKSNIEWLCIIRVTFDDNYISKFNKYLKNIKFYIKYIISLKTLYYINIKNIYKDLISLLHLVKYVVFPTIYVIIFKKKFIGFLTLTTMIKLMAVMLIAITLIMFLLIM